MGAIHIAPIIGCEKGAVNILSLSWTRWLSHFVGVETISGSTVLAHYSGANASLIPVMDLNRRILLSMAMGARSRRGILVYVASRG